MLEQDSIQTMALQRPADNNKEAWEGYWKARGQPWRTEPEIDDERQEYLAERRNIMPVVEKGIYPFRDVKLSRADVEWLLATHENGRGPVDWTDKGQREREGLDLRGANLSRVDLHALPLTRMCGGHGDAWIDAPLDLRYQAAVNLEWAYLRGAHLEGTYLGRANLKWAHLRDAHLEEAELVRARLESAYLEQAHLEQANLTGIHLEKAFLRKAYLGGAYLREAHLEGADLHKVHFVGEYMSTEVLANLRTAVFDGFTKLNDVIMSNEKRVGPWLADISWGNVNLGVVKWSQVKLLGDEYEARQMRLDGKVKEKKTQLREYEMAVRANRQLAVTLQGQGLNEDAARFAYRAQRLQQIVLRKQRKFGRYLFSGFLDVLAGYGFRPLRSVFWYLFIILGFAVSYYAFGQVTPLEAFILSLTSFHGRGFFPGTNITLSDPRVVLAAFEAVIGLFIEISFIATFTKRFLGS